MSVRRPESGQASVELVALLPVLVLVGALLLQCALAGWAHWSAGGAARAAARAHALGQPPLAAARRAVPRRLRAAVSVRADGDRVRVTVRVPSLVGGLRMGSAQETARFTPQGGGS